MSLLEQLESGRRAPGKGLCVVAPLDPSVSAFLAGRLDGDAVMVRLPGPALPNLSGTGVDDAVGRAVAAACYLHGATEVVLVGVDGGSQGTSSAIDALRRRGVDRESIPTPDLRGFLGLVGDARRGLVEAAATLRAAPWLPADLAVHVVLVDPSAGALSVVESGYDKRRSKSEAAKDGRGPVSLAAPSLTSGAATPPSGPMPPMASAIPHAAPPAAEASQARGPVRPPSPSVASAAAAAPATPRARRRSPPPIPPGLASRPARGPAPPPASASLPPEAPVPTPKPLRAVPAPAARTPSPPAPPPAPAPPKPRVSRTTAMAASVNLEAGIVVHDGKHRLAPELSSALVKVRAFLREEMPTPDRRRLAQQILDAQDAGPEAMLQILIQPVLKMGSDRYRVLNELLLTKEQLAAWPVPVVAAVLGEVLR